MAASKTTDAAKFVLRLPKPLYRRLKQQARSGDVSLNTLIVSQLEGRDAQAAEQIKATVQQAIGDTEITRTIDSTYMVPLGEVGLWGSEYARIRQEGGHPDLPPEIVSALVEAAKRAKVTPEEYWKRRLRERGIDPDAPYVPPTADTSEPVATPDKRVA